MSRGKQFWLHVTMLTIFEFYFRLCEVQENSPQLKNSFFTEPPKKQEKLS